MLKLRSTLLIPVMAIAAMLAGCDNGAAVDTQAQPETAISAEDALTGFLDRQFAGETLPEVTVTGPDGEEFALADAKGEPILLNLWATWCLPCVVEMPLLDELAEEMAGEVQVLTISQNQLRPELVEPFLQERELTNLPPWIDREGALAGLFGGGAVLPLTILYDAEGREVWRVIGAYDWGSAEAREAIAEAQGSASGDVG